MDFIQETLQNGNLDSATDLVVTPGHNSICSPTVVCAESPQPCLTLCDPVGCNPPGSFVPENLQARILEWVAISSSKRSCLPRD